MTDFVYEMKTCKLQV